MINYDLTKYKNGDGISQNIKLEHQSINDYFNETYMNCLYSNKILQFFGTQQTRIIILKWEHYECWKIIISMKEL
jgi:hypothetical protein